MGWGGISERDRTKMLWLSEDHSLLRAKSHPQSRLSASCGSNKLCGVWSLTTEQEFNHETIKCISRHHHGQRTYSWLYLPRQQFSACGSEMILLLRFLFCFSLARVLQPQHYKCLTDAAWVLPKQVWPAVAWTWDTMCSDRSDGCCKM